MATITLKNGSGQTLAKAEDDAVELVDTGQEATVDGKQSKLVQVSPLPGAPDDTPSVTAWVPEDELSEFKDELYESCKDLASCNSFYKCTGSCIGRYGACEYLPLCSGSDLQTLAEMYEEKRAHSELSETTVTED